MPVHAAPTPCPGRSGPLGLTVAGVRQASLRVQGFGHLDHQVAAGGAEEVGERRTTSIAATSTSLGTKKPILPNRSVNFSKSEPK